MSQDLSQTIGPKPLTCKSVFAAAGPVLGILMMAYYLAPRTPFMLITPGWWLMYGHKLVSITTGYLASTIFCIAALFLIALVDARQSPRTPKANYTFSEIPSWLPVAALLAPMIAVLINMRQNADIAPAVCSVMISFTVGIVAALLARNARVSILSLLVLVIIQSVYSLYFRKIFGNILESGNVLREGGTFDDPESLSVLTSTGAAIALVMFTLLYQTKTGILYGLTAAVSLSALLTTWSRGGAICLSIALIWFSIKSISAKFARVMVIICACLLAGIVIYIRSAGSVNSASAHQSVVNRFVIWEQGLREFKGHWLTGVGVGPLIIHITAPTAKSHGALIEQTVNGPKNVILYFVDELGIAGLFVLGLAYICVHRRLTSDEGKPQAETIAISIAWLTLAIYSFIDTPFGGARQYCGNAVIGYLYGATILLARSHAQKKC